ncbi:hypothetical protein L210DRAFT_3651156 [Boletus edulis BED1]|uniref:F-box domain-containing protein n=1 Tax=Boletus edulis BED1 TaxID=1328754 RepID=A0AAD4BIE9_BOLED|nr:hypothetical protein L210DRAFT_3651156 [Boletus edulis BED1]
MVIARRDMDRLDREAHTRAESGSYPLLCIRSQHLSALRNMDSCSLTMAEAVPLPRGEFRHKNPFLDATGDSCPIHKLPVDILSYLFEIVADGLRNATTRYVVVIDSDDPRPSGDVPMEFQPGALTPWLPVSQVCHYWHDIAISTLSLWAVIHIPPRVTRVQSCPPFCCIATQLERSKEFPLDIRIHLDDFSYYPSVLLHTICNTLLAQVCRWRSIEVKVTRADDMYEILDAISEAHIPIAPQLKSVMLISSVDDFTFDPSKDYIKSKRFVLFRSSAPHLETISLIMRVNIDWNQPWISSASDLVTLEICVTSVLRLSWIQFATILRGAPNLQVLTMFDDIQPDSGVDWSDSNIGSTSGNNSIVPNLPIKLPRLRQLHISPYSSAVQTYRNCYIPALKELTISSDYFAGQDNVDVLVAQLVGPQAVTCTPASKSSEVQLLHTRNQSHSSLAGVERLHIDYTWQHWSTGHTDSVYCILNQLTSLSLRGPYEPTFINLLFTPTGQLCDVRLPQLKTLIISYGFCSVYIRHICTLAWHRKDTGVPLRTIIIMQVRRGTFPKDCLLWFQENLETFTSLEY